MSKKLTDLLNEIKPELLQGIEIEKEEILGEESENQKEVSLERIKQLAMEGAKGVPDKVVTMRNGKRKHGMGIKKMLLPLVAVIGLSVGVVAATHYNQTLQGIFGEVFPFSEQVQPIEKSMSASGLTFTAEGAFIDGKTGLFVASFRKDDGSSFEEGTDVGEIRVMTEKIGGMGWGISSQLTEDKKQLNCIIDLSSERNLFGQKLTMKAEGLKALRNKEVISEMDLSKIKKLDIKGNWKNYNSVDGLKLTLSKELGGVQLERMYLSDKGLELITSYADHEGIEDPWAYFSLVDQRTGITYETTETEHYWSNEEALNKDYTIFKGIKAEDLAYLKLKVETNYYDKLVQGNWEVSFKLDKNEAIKTKRVNKVINVGNNKAVIKKVELSALGVTITGNKRSKDISMFEQASLKMKDGQVVRLQASGMNSSLGKFNMYFKVQPEGNEIIDRESHEEVSEPSSDLLENGVTVSQSIQSVGSNMNTPIFIDIDHVESIQIEGVTISF